jgi:hypothetical protein
MFQYALLHYLQINGDSESFVYRYGRYLEEHNGCELNKVFGVTFPQKISRCKDIYITTYLFVHRALRFLQRHNVQLFGLFDICFSYRVIVFPQWENYYFVKDIPSLESIFRFPAITDNRNTETLDKILLTNSISIHVRRGDYVHSPHWRASLGDICDVAYYQNAIALIENEIESPCYFVFSDDINWCKSNLVLHQDVTYIDWNTGLNSYIDMQLMSKCKHNIIANSSFSLWAAWLNENSQKSVVAPMKWINKYPDTMFPKYINRSNSMWRLVDNVRPNISLIYRGFLSKEIVNDLLKQTYSDFELLSFLNDEYHDSRIKQLGNIKPIGNFVFEITESEWYFFKGHTYLYEKLCDYLQTNNKE